jgi:hypothetical protein
LNGAKPKKDEADALRIPEPVELRLTEDGGKWTLATDLYDHLPAGKRSMITTDTLGKAIMPEQRFENPDGSGIVFDTDYNGNKRVETVLPGPFAGGAREIAL